MAPEESVVLKDTGSYQIKLSELRKKFLIAGECIAFFKILCENDAKTVQLKECKEGDLPSECNRIVGLCNGEIEISLGKIDCGKSAETKMIVKGGGGGEISETMHISFWSDFFSIFFNRHAPQQIPKPKTQNSKSDGHGKSDNSPLRHKG